MPDTHSLTGRVLATRSPVHIPDVLADPEYRWASQPVAGYHAMVGVPIFVETDLIGVLAVTRPVPEPFTDDETRLVTAFANQPAIAIANAAIVHTSPCCSVTGQILISQRVVAAVEEAVDAEPVGELKGFGRPVAADAVRAPGSS